MTAADPRRHRPGAATMLLGTMLLAACSGRAPIRPTGPEAADVRARIERALPATLPDSSGWSGDIAAGFAALTVAPTDGNICAVLAVIQQESSFRVDPIVPGLGVIARKEIDARAAKAGIPAALVRTVLDSTSHDGRSYAARIDAARTEKQLSDIFEDFIASVPLGTTLFAERNPIRTRGPMQVNVAFAEKFAAAAHYPYPVEHSIPDELFTRRGGIYFGIAHLLDYRAPYDSYVYRFADFNAGQYASRNAAFQSALSRLSGVPLVPDGALLPADGDPTAPGGTEAAVRTLRARLKMSDEAIHAALQLGRSEAFERTFLYTRIFELADVRAGHPLPRARLPQITLQGPKIQRPLTTEWYARRVQGRYERCVLSP